MTDRDPDHDVWADRLRALAPFVAMISESGFELGTWHYADSNPDGSISMPWFEFSNDVLSLVGAASGWVIAGFDWPAWGRTEGAQRLLPEPAAIAEASPQQLAQVLTALIRSNRYVEGELAGAYESGLLGRVLARVAD